MQKSRLRHQSWCSLLAARGCAPGKQAAIAVGLWLLQTSLSAPAVVGSRSAMREEDAAGTYLFQSPQISLMCLLLLGVFFRKENREHNLCSGRLIIIFPLQMVS